MVHMVHMRHLALLLCLTCLTHLCGCDGSGQPQPRPPLEYLEARVASDAATVDLNALTPLGWDRAYVFGSYTSREAVEQSLGFAWPDYERSAVDVQDGNALVVLVEDGEVVHWFDSPPGIGFGWIANADGYAPEEATFRIDRNGERDGGRVELMPIAPTADNGATTRSSTADDNGPPAVVREYDRLHDHTTVELTLGEVRLWFRHEGAAALPPPGWVRVDAGNPHGVDAADWIRLTDEAGVETHVPHEVGQPLDLSVDQLRSFAESASGRITVGWDDGRRIEEPLDGAAMEALRQLCAYGSEAPHTASEPVGKTAYLVDASASMHDELGAARDVVLGHMEAMHPYRYFMVVRFAETSEASAGRGGTFATDGHKEYARKLLERPPERTEASDGLNKALEKALNRNMETVVLLTDGVLEIDADELISLLRREHARLNVILLDEADSASAGELHRVAEATGGQVEKRTRNGRSE